MRRPGGSQRLRRFLQGRAGGEDVVDDQNFLSGHFVGAGDGIDPGHVAFSETAVGQGGLGLRVLDLGQKGNGLFSQGLRRGLGQELGLVIAALPPPGGGDGGPGDAVIASRQIGPNGLGQNGAVGQGVAVAALELKAGHGLLQRPAIPPGADAPDKGAARHHGLGAADPEISLAARGTGGVLLPVRGAAADGAPGRKEQVQQGLLEGHGGASFVGKLEL